MPNLRSRRIPSPSDTPSPKTLNKRTRSTPLIEPPTPSKTDEPLPPPGPVRRRSLRLSSSDYAPSPKRTRIEEKTILPPGKTTAFTAVENDYNSLNSSGKTILPLGEPADFTAVDTGKDFGGNDGIINQEFGGNDSLNYSEKTILPLDETADFTAVKNGYNSVSVELDDKVKESGRNDGIVKEFRGNDFLSLGSGTRVAKRLSIGGDIGNDVKVEDGYEDGVSDRSGRELNVNSDGMYSQEEEGQGKLVVGDRGGGVDKGEENDLRSRSSERSSWAQFRKNKLTVDTQGVVYVGGEDYSSLFPGGENNSRTTRRFVREEKGKGSASRGDAVIGGRDDVAGVYSREEKGKGKLIVRDQGVVVDGVEESDLGFVRDEEGSRSLERSSWAQFRKSRLIVDTQGLVYVGEEDYSSLFPGGENNLRTTRRYTREEKGKGSASGDAVIGGGDDDADIGGDDDDDAVISGGDGRGFGTMNLDFSGMGMNFYEKVDEVVDLGGETNEGGVNQDPRTRMKEHHKRIARRNAMKFAHFSVDDDEGQGVEQEDGEDSEGNDEVPPEVTGLNVEDWPGPFSTAMKIIREREKCLGRGMKNSCSINGGMPLISWTPKNEMGRDRRKGAVPSLQILCLKILSENVDAIGPITFVPDVLRHTLSQMLCDSRKMNAHFFSRLLEGCPSEIRVADCSWLEEEEFERSIKACNTSRLMVLQLDLCGHCVSDYSLLKAVAPKGLPVLTTISLKGACRISDAGLSALVSAAPVLRSMNLSQCSLLTDVGIKTIADSLGSIVHELYLDDCDTLDAMRILPSLMRLVKLEVLSLRGISGVSDRFIRKLIESIGQNMKELILANCVNLTDSSLKIIAETCFQLYVLDLSYLRKLTDAGMAYLANGCRGIQDLRLCRNAFSDDAVAAFLEASGETLKELSLNNITKVAQNTTLSLARRCKNLESLDLSWCRSLTDEALGLIADSCMSLRLLKIFGCTQITSVFVDGHSNPDLHVVGMKLTPILGHIKRPDFQQGPLYYSAAPSY